MIDSKPQLGGFCEQWPCLANEYDQLVKIEQGQFSEVWSGYCRTVKQKVCIKVMDLEQISTSFEDILQEVQAMRLCEDPNILNCYCSFVHRDQLLLITQLMNKGSCLRVITIANQLNLGEGFEEECIGYILSESLKGLNYLHQRGYIHRDVKAGNILLDESGSVRVSDFGVNRWAVSTSATGQTLSTSLPYHCAPEMIQSDVFDNRVDIWALGITALELAKGTSPFSQHSVAKTLKLILEEDPPSLKSYPHDKQLNVSGPSFSKFFEEFYKRCLQKNPKLRPSSAELLKNKFLRNRSPSRLIQFLSRIYDVDSPVECQNRDVVMKHTLLELEALVDENESSISLPDRIEIGIKGHGSQQIIDQKINHSFVPGTSWIFDLEEVVNNDANRNDNDSKAQKGNNTDSIQDFLEEFDQHDASM